MLRCAKSTGRCPLNEKAVIYAVRKATFGKPDKHLHIASRQLAGITCGSGSIRHSELVFLQEPPSGSVVLAGTHVAVLLRVLRLGAVANGSNRKPILGVSPIGGKTQTFSRAKNRPKKKLASKLWEVHVVELQGSILQLARSPGPKGVSPAHQLHETALLSPPAQERP